MLETCGKMPPCLWVQTEGLGHKHQRSAKNNVNPTQVVYIAGVFLESVPKKSGSFGVSAQIKWHFVQPVVAEDTTVFRTEFTALADWYLAVIAFWRCPTFQPGPTWNPGDFPGALPLKHQPWDPMDPSLDPGIPPALNSMFMLKKPPPKKNFTLDIILYLIYLIYIIYIYIYLIYHYFSDWIRPNLILRAWWNFSMFSRASILLCVTTPERNCCRIGRDVFHGWIKWVYKWDSLWLKPMINPIFNDE